MASQTIFTLKYFYIKYFVLPYSIAIVSTFLFVYNNCFLSSHIETNMLMLFIDEIMVCGIDQL